MYSLFHVLTRQHADEFVPLRCNEQTVKRLIGYFEDLVTEHKLSALVLEGRCLDGDPPREILRKANLTEAASQFYLFSCDQDCTQRTWNAEGAANLVILEEREFHNFETGPFILVMEPRFCGLLAACVLPSRANNHAKSYEMVWTFDPNVVFTAVEYLLARISAQRPEERTRLESLLNLTTARMSSDRLALSFTTKLAMLMQRQNELETATNRISSAISSTLELEQVLQSAVEEVGRTLSARRAALVLWQEGTSTPEGMSVYERREETPEPELLGAMANGVEQASSREGRAIASVISFLSPDPNAAEGDAASERAAPSTAVASVIPLPQIDQHRYQEEHIKPGRLEVLVTYRQTVIGVLMVEDDTPNRNWEDEEVLMVKTVSDQLAVAISHARLFRRVQMQAMTDSLTGLNNHRAFQERLDRELVLADHHQHSLSLILLDLDHLKQINDTYGHRAGDTALCHAARMMRTVARPVDVCARYGGEEFVIILPECGREYAVKVAERLRESIASKPVPKIGQVTASIGVATYPTAAKSKEELIEMADRAMYYAKAAGRNRVRTLRHYSYAELNVEWQKPVEPVAEV
jgi:diguanylate cyclase (GGDEF)-like protein